MNPLREPPKINQRSYKRPVDGAIGPVEKAEDELWTGR
jgi:hypothetical protein